MQARHSYAMRLRAGKGITADPDKAMTLLSLPARVTPGAFTVAIALRDGEGITQDEAQALKLFQIAAAKAAPALLNIAPGRRVGSQT